MLLLLVSFVAGALTILAPCVLPVLPVIIGGSIGATSKDKARPYIIAAALACSLVLFTLLLKVSTWLIDLSPSVLTTVSGSLIILLGIASVAPELWERLMVMLNLQATSQRWLGGGERNRSKYIGPALVGIALGPVFASCSPTYAFILASVLPRSFVAGLFYLTAYSAGLVITLLGLSLAGRRAIKRFSWTVDTHSWFRRSIGVLFVVIGVLIFSGKMVAFETWAANHLPFDESHIEQTLLSNQQPSQLLKPAALSNDPNNVLNISAAPAPAFQGLTSWINSSALTVAQLKGKVVLVDFWTYSCINCIRTLPYLKQWYQAYQKDGLVIVGVNTPEFAFEHNPSNVRAAVKQDGITYPVALDNDYSTWNAYQNNSWPADYLIDRNGNIRYVAVGEGDYDRTEAAIQELLGVQRPLQTPHSAVPIAASQTPETYFGSERRSDFEGTENGTQNRDGSSGYTPTATGTLDPNAWTLGGNWKTSSQYITAGGGGGTLAFRVIAKDVYVVASGTNQMMHVQLSNGSTDEFGSDAPGGIVQLDGSRLYHIVSQKVVNLNVVTLTVPAGVSLYTFTFGS